MLGFLSDIKQILSQIMEFGWWLTLAAGIAVLAALFRPLLGYIGVAVGGAVLMFLALWSDWLADDSDRIKALEAQLRDAEIALDISEAARIEAQAFLEDEQEIATQNKAVLESLRKRLDKIEDKPDCKIDGGFLDELNQLR